VREYAGQQNLDVVCNQMYDPTKQYEPGDRVCDISGLDGLKNSPCKDPTPKE